MHGSRQRQYFTKVHFHIGTLDRHIEARKRQLPAVEFGVVCAPSDTSCCVVSCPDEVCTTLNASFKGYSQR